MEIINQLLNIDPNYILIGLITVFFLMEMAVIRPFNFKGKFKHLFHSSLFRIVGIFLGSLLGFMFVTTFDYISTNNFGLLYLFSIPLGIKIIVGFFDEKQAPTPMQALLPINPSCPNILISLE